MLMSILGIIRNIDTFSVARVRTQLTQAYAGSTPEYDLIESDFANIRIPFLPPLED
jgi:hypothetical protein